MFSTARYFIKTSVVFLILGILTGLYMSFLKYVFHTGYNGEILSAHTHIILVGAVIMMIMGVALWFFPRPEKNDKKYKPSFLLAAYWLMTITTALRFVMQMLAGFYDRNWLGIAITLTSTFQVIAIAFFFYSMWGRIRPVGSQFREAKGEKF